MVLGCGQIAPENVTIQHYTQSTRIVHFQVKRYSHVSLLAGRECVVPIEPIPVQLVVTSTNTQPLCK